MVRRRELIGLVAVLALLWGVAASGARAGEVTVFAAASLKDAMDQIARGYEASQGQRVVVSLAGSSALARQIEYGAPADVFLSANVQWMDYLENKGLIETASRIDLLGNQLVLVAPKGRAASESTVDGAAIRALLGDGRLAMALVDAVPAGQYGKAGLEALGIWDALRDRVAQVDNVRAALALVALGEAPLGIVYRTDALASDAVDIVGIFPPGTVPEIVYSAAVPRGQLRAETSAFMAYLTGPQARAAFRAQGFVVLSGPGR